MKNRSAITLLIVLTICWSSTLTDAGIKRANKATTNPSACMMPEHVASVTAIPNATSRLLVPVADANVKVVSFQFAPKIITVKAGAVVEWTNEGGRHTIEADNGSFKSDVLGNGAKYQFKFDKPGTYAYHCSFHGAAGGKDMAGKVIVKK